MENFYFGILINYIYRGCALLVHERLLGNQWNLAYLLPLCGLGTYCSINVCGILPYSKGSWSN